MNFHVDRRPDKWNTLWVVATSADGREKASLNIPDQGLLFSSKTRSIIRMCLRSIMEASRSGRSIDLRSIIGKAF